jgi:methylated-DNA-[protein]-cysteine S-methyltransferase
MDTESTVYDVVESPVGALLVVGVLRAGEVVLHEVRLDDGVRGAARYDPEALAGLTGRVRAYFAGERREFGVAHTVRGTEFQRRVWAAVDGIPYGTTVSYGELARRVGASRDRVRAVAAAVGANPLLVVRPCHRVIGANGALTGYAAGVERKKLLLAHEGAA